MRLGRGHLAWPHSGLTGAHSAPKGSLQAWGPQTVHLGRGPEGSHCSPFPWGSAGTSCPRLFDGITPGWSPGAQGQVLQAVRAQGSYQNSACSRRWTQGWPQVSSREPRYQVQGPSLPSSRGWLICSTAPLVCLWWLSSTLNGCFHVLSRVNNCSLGEVWSPGSCLARLEVAQFSSIQPLSRVRFFETHGLQHARPPCPSPVPRVYSDSCPLSR